ncbi:MAG: hypothetical protein NTY19_46195 [Planctomycetota bacterium]|nr:hypothetical protein [Planctomycetota bacterium]
MNSITIPVPDELLKASGGSLEALERELRCRLARQLLQENRLSADAAALMAGVPSLDGGGPQAGIPSPLALTPNSGIPLPSTLPHQPTKDWPHAPVHRLSEHGNYIVTAGTWHKTRLFDTPEKLTFLENQLLSLAHQYGWQLEAWAVFANHYHFVAHGLDDAKGIRSMLSQLHADCARKLNELDGQSGRKVWHNFWDTELTYEKSYLARLNYVHQNPVKHGLVRVANQYPWCSAAWFERTATRAMIKTIYGFKTDRLKVPDDF